MNYVYVAINILNCLVVVCKQKIECLCFGFSETMGSVKDVLGRWGKKMGEATRKAEDFAGNTWQHCKHSPLLEFFVCVTTSYKLMNA